MIYLNNNLFMFLHYLKIYFNAKLTLELYICIWTRHLPGSSANVGVFARSTKNNSPWLLSNSLLISTNQRQKFTFKSGLPRPTFNSFTGTRSSNSMTGIMPKYKCGSLHEMYFFHNLLRLLLLSPFNKFNIQFQHI